MLREGQGSVEVLARSLTRVNGVRARGTLIVNKSPDQSVTLGPVRGIVTSADNCIYDLFEKTWWRPLLWDAQDWIMGVFSRIRGLKTNMSVDITPPNRHTIVGVLEAASRDGEGAS